MNKKIHKWLNPNISYKPKGFYDNNPKNNKSFEATFVIHDMNEHDSTFTLPVTIIDNDDENDIHIFYIHTRLKACKSLAHLVPPF